MDHQEISDMYGITVDEVNRYKSAFVLIDKDKSGYIELNELATSMRALDLNPTDKELQDMITEKDKNGDGKIDFKEFCVLMIEKKKSPEEYAQEFVDAFKIFDKDGSGKISRNELFEILTKIGGNPVPEEDVDAMLKEADLDNDGEIDMKEFVMTMTGKKSDGQKSV